MFFLDFIRSVLSFSFSVMPRSLQSEERAAYWQPLPFPPQQIDAHAEDQHGACERQIIKSRLRHKRLDQPGQQSNRTLKQANWNRGKQAALSHGRAHHQNNDKIQRRLPALGL